MTILYQNNPQPRIVSHVLLRNLQILCDIDTYLRKQPSLVDINVPEDAKFTICGDIHGQFYDLMNIFKINGLPSPTNPYLFNGDFVDRGSFSVECIFTLFGFKLLYPDSFFLSRGNHESYNMNQMYGFSGNTQRKQAFDNVANEMAYTLIIIIIFYIVRSSHMCRFDV